MWEISNEELRRIMSGDFRFFRCLDCDGEGVWYFKDYQAVSKKDYDGNYDDYETCTTCGGLGGKVHLGVEL